jgi:hypothetical protein
MSLKESGSRKGAAGPDAGTVSSGVSSPYFYIASTAWDVPKDPNSAQRQVLEEAGYGVLPDTVKGKARVGQEYFRPDGTPISANRARLDAKVILATPPLVPAPAPAPSLPTSGDLLGDLLDRPFRPGGSVREVPDPEFERLLRRGPQSDFERLLDREYLPTERPPATPTPDTAPGKSPGSLRRVLPILGRVGGLIGGLLYPSELGDDDVIYPLPGPAPAPPTPAPPITSPADPEPPLVPADPTVYPFPEDEFPPPIPDSKPPPLAPEVPVLLPLPPPNSEAQPQPQPAPGPTVTATPDVGFYALPWLLPKIGKSPRTGRTPSLANFTAPLPVPLPRGLTQVQLRPLTSAYGEPPGDRCECKGSRKPKRKRKPREICYAGDYREKRSGITKDRRRRIKCL